MRELTKEEQDYCQDKFLNHHSTETMATSSAWYGGFHAALDYVESKRCVWTLTNGVGEGGMEVFSTQCGKVGCMYGDFCPDCGARIEVKE